MERRISALFAVFSKSPLQVQLFSHQAQYKVHQMPRWYPIQHRWRHQLILFWNPISKCLRHAPIQFLSTVKYGPHYLDRLLIGDKGSDPLSPLRLSSDRLIQREHSALGISKHSNGADIRHQGGRHDRRRSELSCLCSAGFAIGYMEVGHPMSGGAWGRIYVGRDSSDHVFCERAIDDVTVTVLA